MFRFPRPPSPVSGLGWDRTLLLTARSIGVVFLHVKGQGEFILFLKVNRIKLLQENMDNRLKMSYREAQS